MFYHLLKPVEVAILFIVCPKKDIEYSFCCFDIILVTFQMFYRNNEKRGIVLGLQLWWLAVDVLIEEAEGGKDANW